MVSSQVDAWLREGSEKDFQIFFHWVGQNLIVAEGAQSCILMHQMKFVPTDLWIVIEYVLRNLPMYDMNHHY